MTHQRRNGRFGEKPSIFDRARGRWKGILLQCGIESRYLSGRNCPCPQCGGVDRFRFTNNGGDGVSICNKCGTLSGMQLLQVVRGWDFATAAREIEGVMGDLPVDQMRRQLSPDERRDMLRKMWALGEPVRRGDPVDLYLTARGVGEPVYPKALRCVQDLSYEPGLSFPAMLAAVQGADGKVVTIHRTWVQGGAKAPVDSPRKMAPGPQCGHGAVRLAEPGAVLGIAEGIETAMAASAQFDVPTWAALSAGSLQEFDWPEGVEELVIFIDNDSSFTGHAAGYMLAKRAKAKGLEVTVQVPACVGTDFADYDSNMRFRGNHD